MKRAFDLILIILTIPFWLPLLVIVFLCVRISLGRPALFCQTRPGLNGDPFTLIKFRTMKDLKDASGQLLPDEIRLTRFGKFLRSTSLDELPEIINVLRGEMSLVGPRPLLMQYLGRYTPEQARRHEVRPGITGLAQVSGRNAISWEEKFQHDVYYVDNHNLYLDMIILWKTLRSVFLRKGISEEGEATMKEFMGTDRS